MDQDDLQTLADSGNVSLHRGFPNPALDRIGQSAKLALDLNQLLVRHPSSSYLFRVSGHQNAPEGIFDGDLALIDRGLQPRGSDLVLAWQPSGFIICRYSRLQPEEVLWGVVSAIIHQYRGRP